MRLIVATTLAGVALTAPVTAQTWPTKPISVIAAFAPGGTVDLFARVLAPALTKLLGQSVLVENRGGAGGTLATAQVARATPDGYTLLAHHMGIAFNASLYEKLPYDTLRDITPIVYVGYTPNILVVTNSFPPKTVDEFLAAARATPGAINYGTGGIGSAGHLPVELLQTLANVKLTHVPYKGSGPAVADLLSGQIQTMLLTLPAIMSHVQGGKVRALATSGAKRTKLLPNLPTLAEAGVKGFDYEPWFGFFAPAKTTAAVLDRFHAAVNVALEEPSLRDKLVAQGLEVGTLSRAEFTRIVQTDTAKWAKLIKQLGIKAGE